MKRKILLVVVTVTLCCFIAVWWFNRRNKMWHDVDANKTAEEILQGFPQIEITEKDRLLVESLLALPQVAEAMEANVDIQLSEEVYGELQEQYLPDMERCFIFVLRKGLSIDMVRSDEEGNRERTILSFYPETKEGPTKHIAIYPPMGEEDAESISYLTRYENMDNETITQYYLKRDWLYFLKG